MRGSLLSLWHVVAVAPARLVFVKMVRNGAKTLPRGAAVIDLGCGPGFPITEVLVAEGLWVFCVDAAPSFVQAFDPISQT